MFSRVLKRGVRLRLATEQGKAPGWSCEWTAGLILDSSFSP